MKKDYSNLVIISGGLDSTACALWVKENLEANTTLLLFFDYGQVALKREEEAVRKIANYLNFDYLKIDLKPIYGKLNFGLKEKGKIPLDIDIDDLSDSKRGRDNVWVPARNLVFLSIATAIAEAKNIKNIFIGINKEEAVTFEDNRKDFVESFEKTVNKFYKNFRVVTPFYDKDKEEILSWILKVDKNILNYIWSCYFDKDRMCGECESCRRLKKALRKVGEEGFLKQNFLNID